MKTLALVLLLALAGCSGETIYLRDANGQTAECAAPETKWWHWIDPAGILAAQSNQTDCVVQHEKTGFKRVSTTPEG